MSTVRSTLATPVHLTVRPITVALAGLLVTAALALAIALSVSAGNGDNESGFAKSVRVTPSAPLPPSAVQRHQQTGLDGPGMRP